MHAPRSTAPGASRQKPKLEIIPDTRFIVFHGTEHEAAPVKLSGVVRLTTPDSMSILKPRIRLEGKRKISWWFMGSLSAGEVMDKKTFWEQEQKLGSIESAHKVKAGVLEWPFEFELSPSMPESVEGLRETYIAYHMHATVSRPGWNSKDVVAEEHLRIVRTLGPDSMEMTRSRVNSDVWANKISYSISIPTDAVVFGTSVVADVELSPIKKGLKMGKIELRLLETVVKRIQLSELPDSRADRTKSEEAEVAKQEMEFPEHSRVMYDDETPDNPTMGDEMYRFKATLPLPKSLNECRQDVDSHQINITHRFKLMVNLHNPEGHVSQLVCRLPVKIFISPNLPVDESNVVRPHPNGVTDESLNSTETTVSAPPQYGQHQLDQLFSDMDPATYMSRAPSNSGTPEEHRSRRGSGDETYHPNGMLNGVADGEPLENHGSASPSMLQSRLANLQDRNDRNSYAFSNNASRRNSPGPGSRAESRRGSAEDATGEVRQTDYNISHLSRVPSYGYALRTSGTVTPFTEGPPTYVEATSRPPSPVQRPDQAHVRCIATSPGGASSQAITEEMANFSVLDSEQSLRRPPRSHRGSTAAEDEARARMVRERT